MSLTDWKSQDLEYLKQFYSEGQEWTWGAIESKQSSELSHVSDWLAVLPVPGKYPIALPVREEGQFSWVAIAFSEGQCEELRELLNAFIGPICSSFSGSRTKVDSENTRHQVTVAWAGGARFFDFEAVPNNKTQRARLRESVAEMLGVLKRRPTLNSGILRTTEGLLREFRSALVNQDQCGAEEWLRKIRDTGRLSAENLRFLRIEYHAAFGMWRDMRLGSEWPLIVRGRRPKRTTALMIESLWWNHFQESLVSGSIETAINQMRERVLPDNRALFRSTRVPLNPVCAVTFLLAAACDSPYRPDQVLGLLETIPEDSEERKFADLVFAKMSSFEKDEPDSSATDPFAVISSYLQRDDYDGAWKLLLEASPCVPRCRLMLQCVYEFLSPELAHSVSDAVEALNDAERAQLLSSRSSKNHWDEIQSLAQSTSGPDSWEEWLDYLESGQDAMTASQVAGLGGENWSVQDYRSRPDRIHSLSLQIEKVADSDANPILRNSSPDIAAFFLPGSVPESEFLPIYLSMLNAIALSEQVSTQDWTMVETLTSAILGSGPSRRNYSDMVGAVTIIWETRAELNRLGWALDQLDSLIVGPHLDENSLSKFFDLIRNTCAKFARRIGSDQRHYFGLLCDDLNRRDEFDGIQWAKDEIDDSAAESTQEEIVWKNLDGRSIGIYTLNESAAVRAANLIKRLNSNVKVRLNHDHGGSDKLKVIARDSDFLIVVTQSAKHAATEFIKAQRPSDASELIFPLGRGAASIVSALKRSVG
jgi:hypothetical protein